MCWFHGSLVVFHDSSTDQVTCRAYESPQVAGFLPAMADTLRKDIDSMHTFLRSQMAVLDEALMKNVQSAQFSGLKTRIEALATLETDEATALTDAIKHGPWTADEAKGAAHLRITHI